MLRYQLLLIKVATQWGLNTSVYWWLYERLWYLQCVHTGDNTVLHKTIFPEVVVLLILPSFFTNGSSCIHCFWEVATGSPPWSLHMLMALCKTPNTLYQTADEMETPLSCSNTLIRATFHKVVVTLSWILRTFLANGRRTFIWQLHYHWLKGLFQHGLFHSPIAQP